MFRFIVMLFVAVSPALAQSHTHFEGRQTHAIDRTPDGILLLAVNTPGGTLCVHSLAAPGSPVLIAEISTGTEPVAVRARNNQEAWVVNEASDTVAVVSLVAKKVIATLSVLDEPADVVFANGRAFVTCSQNRLLRVFNADSLQSAGSIPLQGISPRSLAVSSDGTRVYAAFLYSGNRTTVLPASQAPAQPAPSNPALPAAPRTALIVPANDSRIPYSVLDHDIAEIDTQSLTVVRYLGGTGTNLFDLAPHPVTGNLWIANSESHNLIRFEPELKGRFSSHRLTRVPLDGTGQPVIHDLNPGIDPGILPNPTAQAVALAQPTGIHFSADGTRAWVAAFNSDRVAEIDPANGNVLFRIDVRTGSDTSSAVMRGPRSLVSHPSAPYLYVLNKLSNTISIIDTAARAVTGEAAVGSKDPLPAPVKEGRGFFYDARLSGNGTVSCATCHVDADRDGIAWDLGDPGGEMVVVPGSALSAHITTLKNRNLHPMKGPMVTQTLRGMASNAAVPGAFVTAANPQAIVTKFHWRGDKPSIQSFNSTFVNLLGGGQIPAADMDDLAAYLLSISHPPNPNRNPDRSLRTNLNGANAQNGNVIFQNHLQSHCTTCHPLSAGTDQNLDLLSEVGGTQSMKNPPLRTTYQRAGLFNTNQGGISVSGFGLGSDGTQAGFPVSHPYVLADFDNDSQIADVAAFVMSFDTGTAPAATASLLFTSASTSDPALLTSLAVLENAVATAADLTVHANIGGSNRSYLFEKTGKTYLQDQGGIPALTRSQLLSILSPGDTLLFLGTPPGMGRRASIDRDGDAILNRDESLPVLSLQQLPAASLLLRWPSGFKDWFVETSDLLSLEPWRPYPGEPAVTGGEYRLQPVINGPKAFFRLRRTW